MDKAQPFVRRSMPSLPVKILPNQNTTAATKVSYPTKSLLPLPPPSAVYERNIHTAAVPTKPSTPKNGTQQMANTARPPTAPSTIVSSNANRRASSNMLLSTSWIDDKTYISVLKSDILLLQRFVDESHQEGLSHKFVLIFSFWVH